MRVVFDVWSFIICFSSHSPDSESLRDNDIRFFYTFVSISFKMLRSSGASLFGQGSDMSGFPRIQEPQRQGWTEHPTGK